MPCKNNNALELQYIQSAFQKNNAPTIEKKVQTECVVLKKQKMLRPNNYKEIKYIQSAKTKTFRPK